MPAAARKPKAKPSVAAELCRELLEIRRDNAVIFTRIDAINTRLKAIAGDEGKSFRETFVDLGYVSVSPAKPEQTTGNQPVLQIAEWNCLTEARQAKLIDQGIVEIMAIVKRASYGQVRVKLHTDPEGDDE